MKALDDYKTPWVEIYEGYFEVSEDGLHVCYQFEELWVNGKLILDYNNKVYANSLRVTTLGKGKHYFNLIKQFHKENFPGYGKKLRSIFNRRKTRTCFSKESHCPIKGHFFC